MDRVVKAWRHRQGNRRRLCPERRQDLATGGLFHADEIASNVPIDRVERREYLIGGTNRMHSA